MWLWLASAHLNPAGIYLFKFNNGNTRTMCEIVNDVMLLSLLLTLKKIQWNIQLKYQCSTVIRATERLGLPTIRHDYHGKTCTFTKSSTPPWMFSTFLKLLKWFQIAQSITFILSTYIQFFQSWSFPSWFSK